MWFTTAVVESAVESQATDRAYRIGQTKEVSVYLPYCEIGPEELHRHSMRGLIC